MRIITWNILYNVNSTISYYRYYIRDALVAYIAIPQKIEIDGTVKQVDILGT
jgi:hypothetical protein